MRLNVSNSSDCEQLVVQGWFTQWLLRYIFPFLFVLSTFGNLANLIVYSHPFLRSSPTVRMLTVKTVANFGSCASVVPNFLYACVYGGSSVAAGADDYLAAFYWLALKYILFSANMFSNISVWLTVAVTAEHWLLVACPVEAKTWSSVRNAHLTVAIVVPVAAALHSFHLFSLVTKMHPCGSADDPRMVYYFLPNRKLKFLTVWNNLYFWTSSMMSMIVPMVVLLGFSLGIWYNMAKLMSRFRTNTEQKQCVVRLALSTMVCHLIFEMPQVVVFICAALYGSSHGRWQFQEEMTASALFLSLTNASIPFPLFLICSGRFRQCALERLLCWVSTNSPVGKTSERNGMTRVSRDLIELRDTKRRSQAYEASLLKPLLGDSGKRRNTTCMV